MWIGSKGMRCVGVFAYDHHEQLSIRDTTFEVLSVFWFSKTKNAEHGSWNPTSKFWNPGLSPSSVSDINLQSYVTRH
jgi:hypothetical protein